MSHNGSVELFCRVRRHGDPAFAREGTDLRVSHSEQRLEAHGFHRNFATDSTDLRLWAGPMTQGQFKRERDSSCLEKSGYQAVEI